MPPHITVPPTGVERGAATKAFCVVWANEYPDELGFRVSVVYENGEVFTHLIGPDEHDFVFPPEEAPVLSGPCIYSRQRGHSLSVVVVRPGGDEPVGGVAMVGGCDDPFS